MSFRVRWPFLRWNTSTLLLVCLAVSCDAPDARGVRRTTPENARGDSVIRGRVIFTGTPPVMQPIENRPCHSGAKPIRQETVLVDSTGGLKNVFVYLQGGPAVDGSSLPPAVLDQIDCRYEPHVVGVTVKQPLIVKSSDPTLHNTHYTPANNPSENFALRTAGHQKTVRFIAPEIFPVRCDVHPWMTAYIGVFDNPFFSITTDSGEFLINNVPEGDYTLTAWHEIYGELRQKVTVKRGQAIDINFEYKPPGT